MLATVLFSAAFTTGDTLTNSLRIQALENLGRVDVVVMAERPGGAQPAAAAAFGAGGSAAPETRERYFDRLSGVESVTGVAPLAREIVPITSPGTDLSEPRVDVLGMDAGSMRGFDRLETASGETLALGDLGGNEVYLSAKTAEELGVGVGDEVEAALFRPAT